MNKHQLREMAETLLAIADGAKWECYWSLHGWGHPLGRDIKYCIRNRVRIRIKE